MANNVKLLQKDVLEALACTVASAKTSVLASTARVHRTIPESVANMSSTPAKLDSVRTEPLVSMKVKIILASVLLASKERTVMKTLSTAKRTLAHRLQHASIYPAASTANVHSI